MTLDETRFPLVFMRSHDAQNPSMEEQDGRNRQLEALLDRQHPFVLIADHADHDHDDETPEERRAKALFFKRIKSKMKAWCLGLVVIEGHSPLNGAARLAASAASKALGFSVQFAPDEATAVIKAEDVLKKHAI